MRSTWGELSDKLVSYYKFPNGTKFALKRKSASVSSRPYVRADLDIRRKRLKAAEHPRGDDVRVIEIRRAVEDMLPTSLRTEVVILKPDGAPADGKLSLKKMRLLPGKPTQEDRDAEEIRRLLVEEVQKAARTALQNLEEGIEDPHAIVTEGVIRALEDRYGADFVREVIRKLRF